MVYETYQVTAKFLGDGRLIVVATVVFVIIWTQPYLYIESLYVFQILSCKTHQNYKIESVIDLGIILKRARANQPCLIGNFHLSSIEYATAECEKTLEGT